MSPWPQQQPVTPSQDAMAREQGLGEWGCAWAHIPGASLFSLKAPWAPGTHHSPGMLSPSPQNLKRL